VVLARLFNEASGQKAPSKKHGLFISLKVFSLIILRISARWIGKCIGVNFKA
ncbi:MAG: hypothetical protein ACI9G6_001459, partial [Limisphaerales bacterium]